MAISNVSSNLRAGVCTSTTRPTAPYEGQTIYETDTDLMYVWSGTAWIRIYSSPTTTKGDIQTYSTVPDRLAVGSNNRYLRANSSTSTGLEWSSAPVGLELITTVSFSGNNATADNVFTSTHDNYVVTLNLTSASSTTGLYMRMRSGGSTNAGSNYLWAGFVSYMGSSILTQVNSGGATTDWFLGSFNTADFPATPVRIEIMQPFLSYRTSIVSAGFQPVSPFPYYRHIGGTMNNTTSYDGLSIVPDNSGFTITGTMRVYGYRNS